MSTSIFSAVEMAPRDPILGLNESFAADSRPGKDNLGVGVKIGTVRAHDANLLGDLL